MFTAIKEASGFVDKKLGVKLYDYENYAPVCSFKAKNKECTGLACPYFKSKK
ncbi:hypothetical protein EAL2_c15290 [Peptoclostridium acidaminophilum DSM 3953]|uniref:DUF5714 domain-containing protein n=1 Tax=Peptoclostridium acidaminophilum DSM 3953 TaxID=1286171 RepID=W8T4X8_PEPAC|nr:DUF5714 domain-containing protein [Peptoclostridium acidaminophilum]AHM56824.1 hypothetical protein EAL2_c15290 [Peptoclostridium acidaminophilum DSM 3953]